MELHRLFPQSELVIVNSKEGHDGFLIESAKMNDVILKWINSFNY